MIPAERIEAMEAAGAAAGQDWIDSAVALIGQYAATSSPFLMEDAREAAYQSGLPRPEEPRAWGSVATRARRLGLIEQTGEFRNSKTRGAPMPLWRALA